MQYNNVPENAKNVARAKTIGCPVSVRSYNYVLYISQETPLFPGQNIHTGSIMTNNN